MSNSITANKNLVIQTYNTADGTLPTSAVTTTGLTSGTTYPPNGWDVPLNYNAAALDLILGGAATISVTSASGTIALTADKYQPMAMIFTDTLTANVTYTIPAGVGGTWIVRNNTTGSYTITLQSLTSGASATLTVPQDGQPYVVTVLAQSGGGVYLIYYIPDGSITTAKLANSAVTTAKLDNYSINNTKLLPSVIDDLTAKTTLAAGDEFSLYDSAAVLTISGFTFGGSGPTYTATATTSTAHGLTTGNSVTISGATGNTSVNGIFTVTVTTTTQFTITVTSNASVTGSPVVIQNPGLKKITWSNFQTQMVASAGTAAQYRNNTNTLLGSNQVWSAADQVTLTDATTIAVDMSTFLNATVTLGGNRTLGNPTNTKVGQTGYIRIVQDATGSRTLAYGANWEFGGGVAPVLTTTANAVDILFYQVMSSTSIFASLVRNVS